MSLAHASGFQVLARGTSLLTLRVMQRGRRALAELAHLQRLGRFPEEFARCARRWAASWRYGPWRYGALERAERTKVSRLRLRKVGHPWCASPPSRAGFEPHRGPVIMA